MIEFEIGEKASYNGNKVTVKGLDGPKVWVNSDRLGYITVFRCHLSKIPTFFEAGKTYRSRDSGRTFDCHFVGRIGSLVNGYRYAAGQIMRGESYASGTITNFANWEEI